MGEHHAKKRAGIVARFEVSAAILECVVEVFCMFSQQSLNVGPQGCNDDFTVLFVEDVHYALERVGHEVPILVEVAAQELAQGWIIFGHVASGDRVRSDDVVGHAVEALPAQHDPHSRHLLELARRTDYAVTDDGSKVVVQDKDLYAAFAS